MATLTSLLDEKASRIREQVSGLGREAADTLDHARSETAGGLHAAASSVRRVGHQGSKAIDSLTESTASTLDEAGSYIKKHDLKRAIGESRQLVRRYPAEALALAAAVGFLTGFTIRRLTHSCDIAAPRAACD
jgi:ElaB/YqjD/DUF883 family membrane-anchored ribosome-binding protein